MGLMRSAASRRPAQGVRRWGRGQGAWSDVAVGRGLRRRSGFGRPVSWRSAWILSVMGGVRLQPTQAPGVGYAPKSGFIYRTQWQATANTWGLMPAGERTRASPPPATRGLPSRHHDGVPGDGPLVACTMIMWNRQRLPERARVCLTRCLLIRGLPTPRLSGTCGFPPTISALIDRAVRTSWPHP